VKKGSPLASFIISLSFDGTHVLLLPYNYDGDMVPTKPRAAKEASNVKCRFFQSEPAADNRLGGATDYGRTMTPAGKRQPYSVCALIQAFGPALRQWALCPWPEAYRLAHRKPAPVHSWRRHTLPASNTKAFDFSTIVRYPRFSSACLVYRTP